MLDNFVSLIRTVALPWFATTASPQRLAAEAPVVTLSIYPTALIEWLASKGEHSLAGVVLRRWLTLHPHLRSQFDEGMNLAREGLRPYRNDTCVAAGWTSFMLGIT
ncbi:hypothetical protein [Planotetraspora kaengkrachanensis]|uniref:Uncharacterized protein n=1 Tax=Planotetraspora kaengkrachanensis TaxID=575193 RepID=A0A8J3M5D4_9ACTN|nr:hypothetical protein [Planotetraspora kaengkrachanensis]GIG79555.1 hypothetical protein Pka01_26820 [Planotetraspora kaengkrachanensis]